MQFIMIDGEGTGEGSDHKYILLGCGSDQLERPDGFRDITEIFGFLYDQFLANPGACFAGYYLGYDFNMWLRLLPRDRAYYLLTADGRKRRQRICKCRNPRRCSHARIAPHPVEYKGWQFDILGFKRMRLRPKSCSCPTVTCKCTDQAKWMYVNDAGPFFQASLLTTIDPAKWNDPIVTDAEYATIVEGKGSRGSAVLDADMRRYNALENDIGARLLDRLNTGFTSAGIRLNKKQWFGPGQSAQAWMRIDKKLEVTTQAVRDMPRNIRDAVIATYYGGWFELMCHGIIGGITYEYDINSAYPTIASRMPCMCGDWKSGKGSPPGSLAHRWINGGKSALRLCYVAVQGASPYIGALPYRNRDGSVNRPRYTKGWYWQHEIDAAKRAGLVSDVTYYNWYEYQPCAHRAPLRSLAGLYEGRQRVGKDTAAGKAYKLVYNSVYGKLAQSVGDYLVYANPVYASLITSGCRTMILDAIATHPGKAAAVAMVATDGVYFMAPHPALDTQLSDDMGAWSRAEKHDLCLFKPGVYWDDASRERINLGQSVRFKARGINAQDFARSIADVDAMFDSWQPDQAPNVPWPAVTFHSRFTQISVLQALQWSDGEPTLAKQESKYRHLAGQVISGKKLDQDSKPDIKRNPATLAFDHGFAVWRTQPWDHKGWPETTPYEKRFGTDNETNLWDEYQTPDGSVMMSFREALYSG